MRKRTVNIVLLNYNGKKLLEKYFPSVVEAAKRSCHDCRVSVIDNKSSDDSVQYLRDTFPGVGLFIAKENRVLCSFNDVVKNLPEDIVIFLNNDIALMPDFVDHLVGHFDANPSLLFAAPKECSLEGEFRGGVNRGVFELGFFKNVVKSGSENSPQYSLSVHGGAFDREKFTTLGGYDDLYLPGYVEDLDLCYRGWKRGWIGVYEPKSVMLHEGCASFNKAYRRDKKLAIVHRNTFLFFWKNVTSSRQMILHVVFLPLRLAWALVTGRWAFVSGFFEALKRMGRAFEKRNVVKKTFVLSDEEVLKKIERPFECAECKNTTQRDVFSANVEYHDKIAVCYEKDASTRLLFDKNSNTQHRIEGVIKYLRAETSGQKFLDIGCGTGNVLKHASAYFKEAVGIDGSSKMLKEAEAKGLSVVRGDALNLPWVDGTFDAVSAFSVVHHFLEPEALLREACRVLKKDGFLYTDWDPNRKAVSFFDASSQSETFKFIHGAYMYFKKLIRVLPKNIRQESDELGKLAEAAEYHHKEGLDAVDIVEKLKRVGFKSVEVYFHNDAENLFKPDCLSIWVKIKVMARRILNGKFGPLRSEDISSQFAILARK